MSDLGLTQLVSCHRNLRGPYTGTGTVLRSVVPEAYRCWPDLVEHARVVLLYTQPGLASLIGDGPRTLVALTPHAERTRYFGDEFIRGMSQGLVTFLLDHARRYTALHGRPLSVGFDDVHAAEATEQELLSILVRRADPRTLRVVLGSTAALLPEQLRGALDRYTRRLAAPPATAPERLERSQLELVKAYVDSDGTADDPEELTAYTAASPDHRARLHDERADALASRPDEGWQLGAIPYHRERGSDPTGAGRRALREALEQSLAAGYSALTVDLGMRGRAVTDPVEQQQDYCHFSAKAASALVPLGRLQECEQIYRELRRMYALPRVHMTCAYALAMLNTRFLEPRDHETALELINTARALAHTTSPEDDPVESAYLQVYEDNGLALIEMHRGNLALALELVTAGMQRLDREIPPDRYLVHRSQLMHNRARVLVALGRLEDACRDYDQLLEWDPYYVEYFVDRANLLHRFGNLRGALGDYDRAIEVCAPFYQLFYNRADLRINFGDVAGALQDLAEVVEMEPGVVDAWLNRGALLLDGGDVQGARQAALRGLDHNSDDPQLLCLLGIAELERQDVSAARKAFDRAIMVNPRHAPAYVQRAVLSYEEHNPEAAVDDLTVALSLSGNDPDLLLNRGLALNAAGRSAAAARDFRLALDLPGADSVELLDQLARTRCPSEEPSEVLAGGHTQVIRT